MGPIALPYRHLRNNTGHFPRSPHEEPQVPALPLRLLRRSLDRGARPGALPRREALSSLLFGGAALVAGCAAVASAQAAEPAPTGRPPPAGPVPAAPPASASALAGTHTPLPLPFKAGSLNGLSERLITSHHDNNYVGAVKNLNRVEQELSHLTPETPPLVVTALRDRELLFRNSKTLHEAYFGNLGGDGRRSGAIEGALAAAYGSTAVWEQHFRATALGLGGGSGWVVLGFELDTGALRTVAASNHREALASALPLLVLDLYEHSYQLDFGAAHPRYIDAFFVNTRWDEVERRFERAQAAWAALRA